MEINAMKGNVIDSAKENRQSYCKRQMKNLLPSVGLITYLGKGVQKSHHL